MKYYNKWQTDCDQEIIDNILSNIDGTMLPWVILYHYGQVDLGGEGYFFHLYSVYTSVAHLDSNIQDIALGHDLLEDTYCTVEDLHAYGCSQRVIDGIVALTWRRNESQSYNDYIKQVMANPDAVLVKIADIKDNMRLERLPVGMHDTPETLKRMAKYKKTLKKLEDLTNGGS